ncbi:hypothetical protein M2459_003143 [Parabacteroides sp. PF5-5]|nr:hypothetical protein [Parabacteroides sp. PH5-39]MDH6317429.1 hypothetical protein [Parabacteroides sp. PF5-13]MDH6321130.1 hypothetical protein [Parabacteroides sp. PH5-13]MDH6324862.1 hypothetical protein [Parabacteroides sp. PH5-8]MDH6328614.1 hypothetical protein [Parabacteroides sp. PH5-41]MDH6336373.1 hypothetical protein [Parabacteroides sp. PF5-5]MDH6347437.1 hypothetical protein [Parabacteroides sp. PH5-46]MDH6362442.1 hypothetical protein [Parabacteroides sp. PH5-16]MDH6378067.
MQINYFIFAVACYDNRVNKLLHLLYKQACDYDRE